MKVELKRYDEVAKAFTHAVEQAPAKANYWNSLATTYSFQNRLPLAVKALQSEQHVIGESSVFGDRYNLGNDFSTMQQFPAAAAAYRRAIQLGPDYGPAWNNFGTIEGVAGNTQAALNDNTRAPALGDEAGSANYARLQQAIATARESSSEDPLRRLRRSQGVELHYRAQRAWQQLLARNHN